MDPSWLYIISTLDCDPQCKSVLFNDDREVITIVLVFTYRPVIVKKQ